MSVIQAQSVETKSKGAAQRMRWIRALRILSLTLAIALAADLVYMLVERLELVPMYPEVVIAVGGAGLLAGLAIGLWPRYTARHGALALDSRLGLKERIASALEFAGKGHDDGVFRLQYADALAHAEAADLRRAFPHRLTREMKLFSAAGILFTVSFLLPHMPLFQSEAQQRERAATKREGAKIQMVAKKMEAAPKETETAENLGKRLGKLGQDMKSGRTTKKEALKKLNKFSEQVKQEQEKLASAHKTKSFEKALQDLQKQEAAMPKPTEQMEKLASMKAATKLTEAMKNQDLQQAAKALEEMKKALEKKGGLSKEAAQALAQKMQALADAFKGTNLDELAEQLSKLAEALKDMNLDAEALKQMMEEAAKAAEAMLGKQLSEEELQRMAQMLEELKKGLQMAGIAGAEQIDGERQEGRWGVGEGPDNERKSPDLAREKMKTYKNPGVRGKGKGFSMQFKGAPEHQEAVSPYFSAYGEYKKTAESALSKEEIPASYRKQVKKYFDSIGPTGD
jgi:hypothetical protein